MESAGLAAADSSSIPGGKWQQELAPGQEEKASELLAQLETLLATAMRPDTIQTSQAVKEDPYLITDASTEC